MQPRPLRPSRSSCRSLLLFRAVALALLGVVTGRAGIAGEAAPGAASGTSVAAGAAVELPPFILTEDRVANDQPAESFASPISQLRYEPRIDLQTRNFAEAQGDITIRGGIFEGTAVQVAGLTVLDPQTGHYAAELPISPEMLGVPRIVTGAEHAFGSLNATAGTVGYDWRPIEDGGAISAAIGRGELNRQSLYVGKVIAEGDSDGGRVAVDAEIARSEADGIVHDGDHRFFRAAGRAQITSSLGRTDLFAGYQSKFFGWPNLYTPFGVAETDSLQTTLLMVSQHWERDGRQIDLGADYRRNRDDYEFDRYQPGLFNPYQHETRAGGAFVRVAVPAGAWRVESRAEVAADSLDSTALTAGHFRSRTYWKIGSMASRRWAAGGDAHWRARFGGTFDDTNREGSAFSPIAELAWERAHGWADANTRLYAQISESSRVPGYTALNSPAGAGLFRGNPDLGREQSRNLEAGLQLRGTEWSAHVAVFRRRDDPMVDWTFTRSAPNARAARLVDIATTGIEVVAGRRWGAFDIAAGYTWLEKDADYGDAMVDASFYALNFPRHRLTFAITARLGAGVEVRSDNEYRVQEPNLLRTIGGDDAVLSSLGIYWTPSWERALELSLIVDNLWNSDFQELPAVPAPGRQISAGATWRW